MKIALIPPIELLEYTDKTDFQLTLPHMLKSSDVYRYVYQKHCEDPAQFVILDNGVAEGEDITHAELMSWADLITPDEIVIPDVVGNWEANQEEARRFAHFAEDPRFRYMFVVQGLSKWEWVRSIEWAGRQPWISTIGLPRNMIAASGDPHIRADMAWCVGATSGKPVHLLGGSPEHPQEIKENTWAPCVRSHDTSAPFNFAYSGKTFRKGNVVKRPRSYFTLPVEEFDEKCLLKNIEDLMEWTGNEL